MKLECVDLRDWRRRQWYSPAGRRAVREGLARRHPGNGTPPESGPP